MSEGTDSPKLLAAIDAIYAKYGNDLSAFFRDVEQAPAVPVATPPPDSATPHHLRCPEIARQTEGGNYVNLPCCDTGMRSAGQAHDAQCDSLLKVPLEDPRLDGLAGILAAAQLFRDTYRESQFRKTFSSAETAANAAAHLFKTVNQFEQSLTPAPPTGDYLGAERIDDPPPNKKRAMPYVHEIINIAIPSLRPKESGTETATTTTRACSNSNLLPVELL